MKDGNINGRNASSRMRAMYGRPWGGVGEAENRRAVPKILFASYATKSGCYVANLGASILPV